MTNVTLPRILLVDDEEANIQALERTLRAKFDCTGLTSVGKALAVAETEVFEVVLSDQRMTEMKGTEFLAKFAVLSPLTTRIILTAFTDSAEILEAINKAQIYRYITKPWGNADLVSSVHQASEYFRMRKQNNILLEELGIKNRHLMEKEHDLLSLNQKLEKLVEDRTSELRLANEKLSELALTDPLTRVLNRRGFSNRFSDEIERSKRYKHAISVAMIDVDHFKAFNDMEGHLCGDEALRKIAGILSTNIRKTDVLCRYGGEEFTLMMPETQTKSALDICERLRHAVESTSFQGSKDGAYLTISVGIAAFPHQGESPEELIQEADRALYEAKQLGRNRVQAA